MLPKAVEAARPPKRENACVFSTFTWVFWGGGQPVLAELGCTLTLCTYELYQHYNQDTGQPWKPRLTTPTQGLSWSEEQGPDKGSRITGW